MGPCGTARFLSDGGDERARGWAAHRPHHVVRHVTLDRLDDLHGHFDDLLDDHFVDHGHVDNLGPLPLNLNVPPHLALGAHDAAHVDVYDVLDDTRHLPPQPQGARAPQLMYVESRQTA
jgi:hypothetical protein